MGGLLSGGGADALASGMLANTATGGGAGLSILGNNPTIQALLASGGGGGGMSSAPLFGNTGGPRQVSPLGQLVPPMLGQATFPQLGQTSILQVLQQLLGQPAGQFK